LRGNFTTASPSPRKKLRYLQKLPLMSRNDKKVLGIKQDARKKFLQEKDGAHERTFKEGHKNAGN
jgi:hypothetical protein